MTNKNSSQQPLLQLTNRLIVLPLVVNFKPNLWILAHIFGDKESLEGFHVHVVCVCAATCV